MTSKPIVLGICAMAKKAFCKPMQETLSNLSPREFQIVIFEEKMIMNQPVETWPICEALICFYSTGFPQEKAEKYVEMHKPFLVNDLVSQRWLRDRRKVFQICKESGICVPFHIVVNRDGNSEFDQNGDRLAEGDDYLEIDGVRIDKPFVEKPVDADVGSEQCLTKNSVTNTRKTGSRHIRLLSSCIRGRAKGAV
jgi:inositol hexakisphosphate/diphosphoinositol-pentakisphosphate kinase